MHGVHVNETNIMILAFLHTSHAYMDITSRMQIWDIQNVRRKKEMEGEQWRSTTIDNNMWFLPMKR